MTHFAGPEDIIVAALAAYRGVERNGCPAPHDAAHPCDILVGTTGEGVIAAELADPEASLLRLIARDHAWQVLSAGGDQALYAMAGRIGERLSDPWFEATLERWLDGIVRWNR